MSAPRPVVFFLSDYGLRDEFVGVVHAVLVRLVPDVAVVDLTHGIPAFDVRAGAESLARAVPHLGPGVVLGVVDPGVGGTRRGVAVRAGGGRWFVAPDNGLVVPAAQASGGVEAVFALRKPLEAPATFDGRDVFAPAAALLATGGEPSAAADEVDPGSLVELPVLVADRYEDEGLTVLRAAVAWVDGFGNVQLVAGADEGPPVGAGMVTLRVDPRPDPDRPLRQEGGPQEGGSRKRKDLAVRRVVAFSDLGKGELGMLADSNGRLAVVEREGSAASATGLGPGAVVELRWSG
ncbi:MAG TPA: SAM-dependent chlorinase/fluorinase [Acidimicrobiales bacterium]|nr:SAM-dependent chlorinase/fluorinase [Acidimicrobiales bacterium]